MSALLHLADGTSFVIAEAVAEAEQKYRDALDAGAPLNITNAQTGQRFIVNPLSVTFLGPAQELP